VSFGPHRLAFVGGHLLGVRFRAWEARGKGASRGEWGEWSGCGSKQLGLRHGANYTVKRESIMVSNNRIISKTCTREPRRGLLMLKVEGVDLPSNPLHFLCTHYSTNPTPLYLEPLGCSTCDWEPTAELRPSVVVVVKDVATVAVRSISTKSHLLTNCLSMMSLF
jgi:hypothetical protein